MKCINCGNEFEGKFCPCCGTKAAEEAVMEEGLRTGEGNNEADETAAESVNENGGSGAAADGGDAAESGAAAAKGTKAEGGGMLSTLFDLALVIAASVLMFKLDIGIGWIIGFWVFALIGFASDILFSDEKDLHAVVSFVVGIFEVIVMIRIGVSAWLMILALAVMVVYEILERRRHKFAKPAEWVMGLVGMLMFYQFYNIYQGCVCIDIAKEYQYASGVTYGDLIDSISEDAKWECTELARFNVLGEGVYDGIVTVTGDINKAITSGERIDPDSEYTVMFYVEKEDKERAVPQRLNYYINGEEGSFESSGEVDDWFSDLYSSYMLRDLFLD